MISTERYRALRPRRRSWDMLALVALALYGSDWMESATPGEQTPTPKKTVAKLIEDLDSDTRKVRQQAERGLLDRGSQILPLLPALELLPNVSVREAVRRIRRQLERAQALDSIKPSRVTLVGQHSLSEVLAEISKQTGNRLDMSALPQAAKRRMIDVAYDKLAFWQALDNVVTKAGLRFVSGTSGSRTDGDLKIESPGKKPKQPSSPVTYSGAFRVTVDSAQLKPRVGENPFRLLRLQLGLTAEPRLRPLFLKRTGRSVGVANSNGVVFGPFDPEASIEQPFGEGGRHQTVRLDFKVPTGKTVTDVVLRGQFSLLTAAGTQPIRFADIAKSQNVARRRGGVTAKIRDVAFKRNADGKQQASVEIALSYDGGGPAFESHRTWVFHNEAYLETSAGQRIGYTGPFRMALQKDGAVAVEYSFQNLAGKPSDYAFVYVAPTLLVDVPLEFTFRKIHIIDSAKEGRPK
jgi:hypothetical protein